MNDLQLYKVCSLPKELTPNAIYLVGDKKQKIVQIMIANSEGNELFCSLGKSDIRSILHEEIFSLLDDYWLKKSNKLYHYLIIFVCISIIIFIIFIIFFRFISG